MATPLRIVSRIGLTTSVHLLTATVPLRAQHSTTLLSFPILGSEWPEVTATLAKKGRQAPTLHLQLPTGHTITLPAELKPGLKISGLPDLSPPPSDCAGN